MGKKATQADSKTAKEPAYVVYARIPAALGRALEAYIERSRPRVDKSGVVEAALEDFLRSQGALEPSA